MDGILPLYKPKGLTSHDCIDQLRKIMGQRKIGHTGTLDPGAEGVLVVCLGIATKVVQYMEQDTKKYEAKVTLGTATTTGDSDGEIVETKAIKKPPSLEEITKVLKTFTGSIHQIPPMVSAVKIGGKRLYEYARKGVKIERPPRPVHIHELALLGEQMQWMGQKFTFSIRVHCSKGTYVRTLVEDIGKELGYPSHMAALLRTAAGPFTLEDCLTFSEIEKVMQEGRLAERLYPPGFGLQSLAKWILDEDPLEEKVKNGAVIPNDMKMEERRYAVYNKKGKLLAVYMPHPYKKGLMKPEKVFPNTFTSQ